jgi:hypothetical protein
VQADLATIKDVPGFVERGELYYRVTPELIAMIAFEAAWRRWAEGRENSFLESIPDALQESFFHRVSEGRNPEVRKTVQLFFRRFADSFSPGNLADLRLVNRLIRIIEIDPQMYLPVLRHLVNSATHDDLTCVPEWQYGGWGPRRQLVWLAERFVQFPEFFEDCEEILFTLASHECEPNISNNASRIWQQLFRIQLSGTALPISARLAKLNARLQTATTETATLIGGALGQVLHSTGGRVVGPPVVSGRIVPREWRPRPQEVREVVLAALAFIADKIQHADKAIAVKAKDVFVGDVEGLARQGWIDDLRPVVARAALDENDRALLVSRLKSFLTWTKHPDGTKIPQEYGGKLDTWIKELEPKSFHARLVESVGVPSWDHYGREDDWQRSLSSLAAELTSNSETFHVELNWLTSSEAKSAFEFGEAVGATEREPRLLDSILEASAKNTSDFARGYISGLIYSAKAEPKEVISRLDAWEEKNPQFAFELSLAGGEHVQVFDRALRLIRSGKLPAYQLRHFTFWAGRVRTTNEQVMEAVKTLIPLVENGDEFCAEVLMDFLGAHFHRGELGGLLPTQRQLIWSALEVFADHPGRRTSTYWWGNVLQAVGPDNPDLAIHLACKALLSNNYEVSETSSNLLSLWAQNYPKQVMAGVGELMLDPKLSTRFFVSKFPMFVALPIPVVTEWLSKVGAEGAQKIARHLPHPYVESDGVAVVPELTAWVLSRFEKDDRVFSEFCAGVHSFQTYTGDIAAAHSTEAESARKFLGHPLPRIRQWAQIEYETALKNAERFREWEDEMKP